MIYKILTKRFDQGYQFAFDITSLFTNVALLKTVNIILKRFYKEKVINTKLQKSTLNKLIKYCCTKTTFSFYVIIR